MKTYRFKARIEPGVGGGAAVPFPFSVQQEFGVRGSVPVKSTLDGVAYCGSLMKCGDGPHLLGVLKTIRDQIGKGPGDSIDVVVWKDDEVRTVAVPAEFEKLLKREKLWVDFEKLSYTHRKEYVRWIAEARKEETRQNRMAKTVTMLRNKVKTPG
jgi:Bacteriocin-protection, YdeI or OmpD-Associated/Domain of unknown function (DUF1905)